ncbi:hypothetical protein EC991_006926 [Linnemannia zychae]|nr:hypothetical protein EC991_006926 [Linnemannia zychae]
MSTPVTETTHAARDKILAIPELVQRIAHHLDSKTIVTCARVNKAWHSAWLPIVWRDIDAGRQWHDSGFLDALHRHADLIRNLKCSRYDDIRLLFSSNTTSPSFLTPSAEQTRSSDPENSHNSDRGAVGPDGAREQVLCRNLISLVLPKTTLTNQTDQAHLIRLNPHLLEVTLTLLDDPSSKYTELIEAVCCLPRLRRLILDGNKTLESHTLERFLSRLNPSLQELSLKGVFFVKHPFGSGEDFAAVFSGSNTAEAKESFGIQSLIMDGAACSQDFILRLCSRFPSLSHFSLGDSAEVYIDNDFGEKLAQVCPQLKSIDISQIESMEDDSIACLIRSLPSLRTFRAAETRFGDESLKALIECCGDLSTLDINTTYVTQSSSVQRLLERSGALTTFDAWELSVNVPEMMSDAFGTRVLEREPASESDDDHERAGAISRSSTYSSARASVAGDRNGGIWACRELESLVLGVDYSTDDLTEQECALYPPSKARQFIYEQLSRLTNLRYLSIGGAILGGDDEDSSQEDEVVEEDEEPRNSQGDDNVGSDDEDEDDDEDDEDWTPSAEKTSVAKLEKKMAKLEVIDQDSNSLWIEFSLRSGLAILAPLKNLRGISVNQGAHAIGVREVEWMSKNWPRLKKIEGLYEDDAEEAVAWLRKHRPDIELEDDE